MLKKFNPINYAFTLKVLITGFTDSTTVLLLLKGFGPVVIEFEPTVLTLVVGFFSIDSSSAEDNFTFEFEEEACFSPVAAEAKLSKFFMVKNFCAKMV